MLRSTPENRFQKPHYSFRPDHFQAAECKRFTYGKRLRKWACAARPQGEYRWWIFD
jgi:hypothetical protein